MSMFDYDARPITPQVVLVGNRASSVGYTIRDFWSRNGVPYEWVDLDDAERVRAWSLRARWIPAYPGLSHVPWDKLVCLKLQLSQ